MSLFGLFRAGGSSRRTAIVVGLLLAASVGTTHAQDQFSRTVAFAEALLPVGVLLGVGMDTPLEAGLVAGSFALQTVPNVLLLFAESESMPRLARVARLASAGAGYAAAAAGLAVGLPAMFGAWESLGVESYSASFLALSIPLAFAASVDLLPYSMERESGDPASAANP